MQSDISVSSVRIDDPFWKSRQRLIGETVLPYQWEVLNDRVPGAEPSYCMRNFRVAAGREAGVHKGAVFLDSDVYKWIEAVAYSLTIQADSSLEAKADEAIEMINLAQAPDGYLNTYYTTCEPDKRFQNLTEGHELYCAGHLFEAAAAYFEATGKRALLEVAIRFADCLVRFFLPGDGVNRGYPGHPEIELALVRLYQATRNEDYLRLCAYYLDVRGVGESRRDVELAAGGFRKHWGGFDLPLTYFQVHAPVREQRKAAGHAVRAMYLYSAMADMACLTGEAALSEACRALFENVVTRQMYVTGGIGSAAHGERFTTDYDLPNDTVYAETCASVGLTMFATRMWKLTRSPACYDVWEKALYNTVLACMGGDGRHFFYVNPLTVDPAIIRENPALHHVRTTRAKWFGVACCPPNMARAVLSIGRSIYALQKDPPEGGSKAALYILTHIDSRLSLDGLHAALSHEGDRFRFAVEAPEIEIRLRIPEGFALRADWGALRDGYLCVRHPGGCAAYAYELSPQLRVLYAHPRIAQDAGKVCLAYGQTVYCLEEADNGPGLCALALPTDSEFERVEMDWLPEGMCAWRTLGVRYSEEGWSGAYAATAPRGEPATLTFVPYSQWNNRGEGEMCVWVSAAH